MTCTCPTGRGTCPWSIRCPECESLGRCRRPSGHPCEIHVARYRESERLDGKACPGLVVFQDGCAICSGLPEDHERVAVMDHEYDPGHPWYYFKGGVPLKAEDIRAARNDQGYNQLVPSKARAFKREQIEAAIRTNRAELARDIARYEELVTLGVSEYERSFDRKGQCKAIHVALSLVHNHISYSRGVLERLYEFYGSVPGTLVEPKLVSLWETIV